MIYKLQKAGSLPKWMQKLNSWSIPDSDESAGERVLNSTIKQANNASTQEERDKIYKDYAKKNLAVTGQSLMMIPMLNEFATYGLLGGGLRLGTGMAGSKAGEYVLGKGGDWLDKQLRTKFLGTTGRIVGGLGGWWGGSSATTPLFRNLAGKGITLHMPQETFMNLRGQYFDRAAKNIKLDASTLPKLQYHDRLMKDYLEFGPDSNIYGDNVSKLVHWDPMTTGTKSALPINGGFSRDPIYFPHFENGKLVPAIGQIRSKLGDGHLYAHPYHPIFFGANRPWWEVPKSNLSDMFLESTTVDKSIYSGPKQNFKRWYRRQRKYASDMRKWYEKYGPQNRSARYLITDPENLADYEFNYKLGIMGSEVPMSKLEGFEYDPLLGTFKRAKYIDPSISTVPPQEAATTYHFDGRMPLTKPISFEEKLGWTRGERMQPGPKNPIPISLINRSDSYLPIEGDSFVLESPEISKKLASVHFTMNEPVTGHGGGSWDSASTTLIFPYGNIRKVTGPINIEPMDTFFPNYNGLRFKTKGAKVLTGDRTVHDYYTQHGVDSQFSEELEALLKEYKAKAGTAEKYLEEHGWIPDEGYFPLRDAETALSDRIQQIHYDFVDKYATRPSYEDLLKLEKIEGLKTGAEPIRYNTGRTPLEDKLGYTWFSAPSTHSGLLFYDPGDNISSLPKPMQDFVKWLWEHKADYRKKKGGIIKGQDGIEELPVQKSSTNVAQKPIPRRALSPIEGDWEEANHDPNLYEYQPYDDPYVKEFFEQDVLPRYMRENPNASQEEIDAVRSAYTNKQIMSSNIKDGIGGRTDTDKFYFYGIPINPSRKVEYNTNYKLSRPVIVHENTHAYRQGLLGNIGEGKYTVPYKRVLPPFLGFGEGSGYTNKEVDYLQNGYDLSGFDFSDYGSEENQKFAGLTESGTTNAEIRYRLWRELYDKLGKVPTLEETDEFIKNYDKSKLWSLINNASAYGQKAYHNMIWNAINSSQELPEDHTDQDEIDLRNETESQAGDRLKDALIHVADNNQKTDMTNLAKEGLKIRFTNKLHK